MPDQNIKVGERIKGLRLDGEMTIEEVSQQSGVSEAVISGIENHTLSPPLGIIVSLAKVFRVTVGELFGDSADSPFCIVRSDGRKPVQRFSSAGGHSAGYSYESLGHQKQNRQMEPFLVRLTPAGTPHTESNQHDGEEFIFVLEGQVEVKLSEHNDILNPGDSIYYDSALPHVVSCYGDGPATILAVIYAKKEMIIM